MAVQTMVAAAADDPQHPVWRLTPFVDLPGRQAGSEYFFEWEREWRHVGDLRFDVTDPAFLIIPTDLHGAARAFFENVRIDNSGPSYGCPFIDPYWSTAQIEDALSAHEL